MVPTDELTDCNEISSFVFDAIPTKKRKLLRACDVCRRRKIRCDGAETVENSCTNCAKHELVCTYGGGEKQLVPTKGYVEELEQKANELQTLLQKLLPEADLSNEDTLNQLPEWNTSSIYNLAQLKIQYSIDQLDVHSHSDSTDEDVSEVLNERNRFWGKSSSFVLVKEALELKSSHVEASVPAGCVPPVRRREFWEPQPWEIWFHSESPQPAYDFPEQDLLASLIDLYFEHINLFSPLLHRPTFDQQIQAGLHYRDNGFATVVLLVCACASRFSRDPRVLVGPSNVTRSCGWKWYNQVELFSSSLMTPVTLQDLQAYCLALEFQRGHSAPHKCWTLAGIAIRQAQDVGAHRHKTFASQPRSIEAELWKRAWWILVMYDRDTSAAAGRPCVTHDEDYDVGLPTECDDEYLDHPDPEKAWKQPPGVPSKVAYFNSYMKQNQILAHVLSLLYCIGKPKHMYGVPDPEEWEPKIVAELDSSLNRWVDTIPPHLRWDPDQPNQDWRRQSISLYAQYYFLQIWIHRQFISWDSSSEPNSVKLTYPSLAICTNAARACCHLLTPEDEKHLTIVFRVQWYLFSSAVVLLLNVFGGRKTGIEPQTPKDMQDVYRCMEMIKGNEDRFQTSGKLWDILWELTSGGELRLSASILPSNPGSYITDLSDSSPGSSASDRDSSPRDPSSSPSPHSTPSPPISHAQADYDYYDVPPQSEPPSSLPPGADEPELALDRWDPVVSSLPLGGEESEELALGRWDPIASSNHHWRNVIQEISRVSDECAPLFRAGNGCCAAQATASCPLCHHRQHHWTQQYFHQHHHHHHQHRHQPQQQQLESHPHPQSLPWHSNSSYDSSQLAETRAVAFPRQQGHSGSNAQAGGDDYWRNVIQEIGTAPLGVEYHEQQQQGVHAQGHHWPQRQIESTPTVGAGVDAGTMQIWSGGSAGSEWSNWGAYPPNPSEGTISSNVNYDGHEPSGTQSRTHQ